MKKKSFAVVQQDRSRLKDFDNAHHCISLTHCPGCQTLIKVAIKHAEIVYGYGWSELHAVAPHLQGLQVCQDRTMETVLRDP